MALFAPSLPYIYFKSSTPYYSPIWKLFSPSPVFIFACALHASSILLSTNLSFSVSSPEYIFVYALHALSFRLPSSILLFFFLPNPLGIHFHLRPSHPKHFVWPRHQQFFLRSSLAQASLKPRSGLAPASLQPRSSLAQASPEPRSGLAPALL